MYLYLYVQIDFASGTSYTYSVFINLGLWGQNLQSRLYTSINPLIDFNKLIIENNNDNNAVSPKKYLKQFSM